MQKNIEKNYVSALGFCLEQNLFFFFFSLRFNVNQEIGMGSQGNNHTPIFGCTVVVRLSL